MAAKTIKMQAEGLGVREFALSHAQGILQMQKERRTPERNCWVIAKGEPFEFDTESNELVRTTNTGKAKQS